MELMAVIVALESLNKKGIPVIIYTDSKYIVDSVQKGWLNNWIRTQFKGGKKNKDLWMRYHAIALQFHVRFVWVKGHADNKYNNRCDELATQAADGNNLLIDETYESENG